MTDVDNTTARVADQTEPAQPASSGGSTGTLPPAWLSSSSLAS